MRLVSELRRRNVLRMVVLYAVAAWLIMQVVEVLNGLIDLPDWIGPTTLALLAIGFPIALVFSWFYELTPEGISLEKDVDRSASITRVTGQRLNFIVISLLSAAVILFAYDKWWMRGPPEKSIAVMAFANLSGDPDQEFLSDGIAENILNLLAPMPELKVISRSSAFSYKGKDVAVPTIAEQLNVAHVLEGSVRRVGNRLRITAQLIDANTDSHLWSRSFEREFDDLFAVQDEIAMAISDALKVKLALVAGVAEQPTIIDSAKPDAYDAYLRGRELIQRRGPQNMEDAIEHLEHSLRLDNDFAPAHAQLAIATTMQVEYGMSLPEVATPIAISHLDRAQELEPGLAEAHAGRALLDLPVDPESALVHARKALAANPSYGDAMNWLQLALVSLGRYDEAHAVLEQMLVMDPLSVVGRMNHADWLSRTGRMDEAHAIADQFISQGSLWGYGMHADRLLNGQGKIAEGLSWALRGNDLSNNGFLAFMLVGEYDEALRGSDGGALWINLLEGRFDEAVPEAQRILQRFPDDRRAIWTAAEILYTAGRIAEALPHFERLRDFVAEGRPIPTSISDHLSSNEMTMRLALARRQADDEDGAQIAAEIAKQDHAALGAAGTIDKFQYRTEAMIAAFENDPDRAIAALESAIQRGMRRRQIFDDMIFEGLWDDARFAVLRVDLDEIVAAEREKVLQLICFNNPAPENWQPLPKTCEGVVEQLVL